MKNQIKTIVLLGILTSILIGVGASISPTWLYIAGALAFVMNVGAYFYSDKLVLRMHGAQEVSESSAPRLHAMVHELALRAGIPKPRVFLIPDAQPNAFATGRNPERGVVAVTQGILDVLSERELRGVLAHEIAHIKNRDILLASIAAMLSSVISQLGNMLAFSGLFGGSDDDEGGSPVGGLALALAAPLAATFVQLAISRSREYLADETGAQLSGEPEALARALLKLERGSQLVPMQDPHPATASLFIVNPLAGAGKSVLRLFSTHPSTEERVRRLMNMASARVAVRGDPWFASGTST